MLITSGWSVTLQIRHLSRFYVPIITNLSCQQLNDTRGCLQKVTERLKIHPSYMLPS